MARAALAMEPPIAILSFDRPLYLQAVLRSLRNQIREGHPVFLFQDGNNNPYSGHRRGDAAHVKACVEVFQKIIPWGTTICSDRNIGIAENYERAEQHLFTTLKANAGLFLEDDMVLSPNYLSVTRQLLHLAISDSRIAYVSAYGNFWASLSEQCARRSELIHIHENWGFAMTRSAWLDERPFREKYLRLVKGVDYVGRHDDAIRQFYRNRGWKCIVTSQDAARWIASIELGKVRLTSFACHAHYIGREGVHSTAAHYDNCGFAHTEMFDQQPSQLEVPTDAKIAAWLDTERRRFSGSGDPFYSGHATELQR